MEIKKQTIEERMFVGKTSKIKISQIVNNPVYQKTYESIGAYLQETGQSAGTAVTVYKEWDEANDSTTLMPGFTVKPGFEFGEFEQFTVPAGEAYVGILKGSYDGFKDAHEAIMKAMQKDKATPTLTVEEYMNMPGPNTKEEDLESRIYYYI